MQALIAILAGGRGTRMGADKALAELGGRPLISYPLAAAAALGGEAETVIVAKRDTRLPGDDPARVLREPDQPVHPLCGIVAALREAGERRVVVVAADMPFVTGELLAWIAALPDRLAVPHAGGRLHPLLGLYRPALLADLERALRAEAPLRQTVASLSPRAVNERELLRFGDPERLVFNVNTPADLEAAERASRAS
jgi:molybdenum cofactor guanylyltransferase